MKIIEVNGLSKKYNLIQRREGYDSLREEIMRRFKGLSPSRGGKSKKHTEFWALDNINFSVEKGEIVGIIGRNGAGKTTLLKILSRITSPTSGEVLIHGRVSSLLEVGTGFHPELTGRENIFLNGAILGMTKKEITAKFEEIVDFAGVGQFLDTPVKRYSSGMYVRLAFAVAAHLEPDVLLVDEVLSVGDYEFQKKCLQKMEDVSRGGRTVLFVSHNMASVINLCSRAILLDKGKVVMDDEPNKVADFYMRSSNESDSKIIWKDIDSAPGDETMRLHSVRIFSQDGQPGPEIDITKDIVIEFGYWVLTDGIRVRPAIHLINSQGVVVLVSFNGPSASLHPDPWHNKPVAKGLLYTTCRIPGNLLNDGFYSVNVILAETQSGTFTNHLIEEGAVSFRLVDTGAMRKEYSGVWPGVVRPRLDWKTEYAGPAL